MTRCDELVTACARVQSVSAASIVIGSFMAPRFVPALVLALTFHALPASATYSIVGADSATREVGGTGTSCLRGSDVYIIYGAAPGFGAIHAQAQANQNGRDRGVELLEQGTAPMDVISQITAASFDANSRVRQYGVVDATGRTAGFTGAGDQSFADDRQGSAGTFSYSVQGNILTSAAVLTQAAAAFEGSGCDLAERLMRALEAGAENGEGDSRCTPNGIPSDSSFIQVERPDTPKGSYLELHVRTSGSESPIPGLRQQFDAWRATHPCSGSPDGGSGGTSGGTGGAGASGSPPTGGSSGVGGAAGRANGGSSASGASSGGASSGGAPVAGGTGGAGNNGNGAVPPPHNGSAAPPDDGKAGCGCRQASSSPTGLGAVSFVSLALLGLRRSSARSRQRRTGV